MIFRDFSTESLTGWCMGMRCIWKRQNSRVWNGEVLLVHVSVILASQGYAVRLDDSTAKCREECGIKSQKRQLLLGKNHLKIPVLVM
jgi:hypothetical protein